MHGIVIFLNVSYSFAGVPRLKTLSIGTKKYLQSDQNTLPTVINIDIGVDNKTGLLIDCLCNSEAHQYARQK